MGAIPQPVQTHSRRWTLEEYMQLSRAGYFADQRVELIEGEIFVMCSQDYSHTFSHVNMAEVLRASMGKGFWIRQQLQLNLSANSAPEPDVSVVKGSHFDYKDHPTTALLVIEVANTSLEYDRKRKASLYAEAGIPDYWIVNFPDWRVDVLREPGKEHDGKFQYASVQPHHIGQFVSPLCKPDVKIAVSDMLPPEDLIRK